jgi:hypothetical protein
MLSPLLSPPANIAKTNSPATRPESESISETTEFDRILETAQSVSAEQGEPISVQSSLRGLGVRGDAPQAGYAELDSEHEPDLLEEGLESAAQLGLLQTVGLGVNQIAEPAADIAATLLGGEHHSATLAQHGPTAPLPAGAVPSGSSVAPALLAGTATSAGGGAPVGDGESLAGRFAGGLLPAQARADASSDRLGGGQLAASGLNFSVPEASALALTQSQKMAQGPAPALLEAFSAAVAVAVHAKPLMGALNLTSASAQSNAQLAGSVAMVVNATTAGAESGSGELGGQFGRGLSQGQSDGGASSNGRFDRGASRSPEEPGLSGVNAVRANPRSPLWAAELTAPGDMPSLEGSSIGAFAAPRETREPVSRALSEAALQFSAVQMSAGTGPEVNLQVEPSTASSAIPGAIAVIDVRAAWLGLRPTWEATPKRDSVAPSQS